MLPTRAESVAKTLLPRAGSRGRKAFISSAGPIALTAKFAARKAASISSSRFSGRRPGACSSPVASKTSRTSASSRLSAAARMLASSSRRSGVGPERLKRRTLRNAADATRPSAIAPPMPPPAPMTTATPSGGKLCMEAELGPGFGADSVCVENMNADPQAAAANGRSLCGQNKKSDLSSEYIDVA